jgi:hypothetical protein
MKRVFVLMSLLLLIGCASQRIPQDQSAFVRAAPRSILIVPIENKSLDVDAANYMLSTLTIPLAERGYYVFPVNTVKVVLEQEGLYEPERVRQADPQKLASYFGADAILYVAITRWDAQYAVLATTVTVELSYRLVSREPGKNSGAPARSCSIRLRLLARAAHWRISSRLPWRQPSRRQRPTICHWRGR